MRNFLLAALVATGATLSAIQMASAAATIPDYQARVNTASAFKQDAVRNANAAIDAQVPVAASRVQFYEVPARR